MERRFFFGRRVRYVGVGYREDARRVEEVLRVGSEAFDRAGEGALATRKPPPALVIRQMNKLFFKCVGQSPSANPEARGGVSDSEGMAACGFVEVGRVFLLSLEK